MQENDIQITTPTERHNSQKPATKPTGKYPTNINKNQNHNITNHQEHKRETKIRNT